MGRMRIGMYEDRYANNISDSTLGKVMEKAGHVLHNEGLVAKGAAKRQDAMSDAKGTEEPPFAN